MNGKITYEAPASPFCRRCETPDSEGHNCGTIWECDCGRVWELGPKFWFPSLPMIKAEVRPCAAQALRDWFKR